MSNFYSKYLLHFPIYTIQYYQNQLISLFNYIFLIIIQNFNFKFIPFRNFNSVASTFVPQLATCLLTEANRTFSRKRCSLTSADPSRRTNCWIVAKKEMFCKICFTFTFLIYVLRKIELEKIKRCVNISFLMRT